MGGFGMIVSHTESPFWLARFVFIGGLFGSGLPLPGPKVQHTPRRLTLLLAGIHLLADGLQGGFLDVNDETLAIFWRSPAVALFLARHGFLVGTESLVHKYFLSGMKR